MDLSHSLGQYIILAFAIAVAIFVTLIKKIINII